ncbi:hypothetical protein Tco_0011535 [Tanacetum coccineum]
MPPIDDAKLAETMAKYYPNLVCKYYPDHPYTPPPTSKPSKPPTLDESLAKLADNIDKLELVVKRHIAKRLTASSPVNKIKNVITQNTPTSIIPMSSITPPLNNEEQDKTKASKPYEYEYKTTPRQYLQTSGTALTHSQPVYLGCRESKGFPYSLKMCHGYEVLMMTNEYGIEFYGKSSSYFDWHYPFGTRARANIENKIIKEYKSMVRYECDYELIKRREQPRDFPTPRCDKLQSMESMLEQGSVPSFTRTKSHEVPDLESKVKNAAHRLENNCDRMSDIMNIMPPKKTTTPMTDAAIKELIAQGVADALAEYEATKNSRNGDDNHDSGSGGRRTMPTAREYTYSDFLKCQPLNFKGIEGVIDLTQWFEKMEYVFHISNCTVAMFPEESDEVEKYVGGLPDMI